MEQLKVCFVGVGSIAKRHIRNLRLICEQRNISVHIDAYRHRKSDDMIEGIEQIFYSVDEVPYDYDIIFVTNPTELHLEALKSFHKKGCHFFIEKPIVSINQIKEMEQFPLREDSVYYVACPLRYNAVIQYLKSHVDLTRVISVRSISSSYLPDWRPGTDYRDTYSAHKDMGGGVSIDLIHEWDYLTYLFGTPKEVKAMIGKKSGLEIDSDDYAIYLADYDHMITELHLDYFGRKTIRTVELIMDAQTIVGDIANQKLVNLSTGETIDFQEERDDFQKRELVYFLQQIENKNERLNHVEHACDVLKLTQGRMK